MPQLIEHIDAIARRKGRDVLFIVFHENRQQDLDWERLPIRRQILDWLEHNGIGWRPCGPVGSTSFICSYRGQVYIDVPFDEHDPTYPKLRDYLENPDSSMAFAGMRFCYLPLDKAMENAEHDAPGFWERWAEKF